MPEEFLNHNTDLQIGLHHISESMSLSLHTARSTPVGDYILERVTELYASIVFLFLISRNMFYGI